MIKITDYKDLDYLFYRILINKKGYPEDTIIREYRLKNNNRVDILININEPVAIVEIKTWNIKINELENQLINLSNSFDENVEVYWVVFDNPKVNIKEILKVYKLNKLNKKLESIDYFPDYAYFKSLKVKKLYTELKESWELFKYLAMFLWFLLVIYHFILVFYLKINLETNQLLILLTWIWLLFFPFLSKIKISWIEIERLPKSNKINTEDKK